MELINLLTYLESSKRNPQTEHTAQSTIVGLSHGEGVFLRDPNMVTSMSILGPVLNIPCDSRWSEHFIKFLI